MNKEHQIALLVGTRPNIVKISQFRKVFSNYPNLELKIIHSNQHYSDSVSNIFFSQFGIEADVILPQFEGHASAHMGHIIQHLTSELMSDRPDLLIVVGDVNTTLAGALVGNKLSIKLAHLESGLRSFDKTMPEEVNRIIVDELSDYFFVTEQSGLDNLQREGREMKNVFFVGNTMIDTLVAFDKEISNKKFSFDYDKDNPFIVVTLHRPSNVDNFEGIHKILDLLKYCSKYYQIIFPMHPRTLKNIESFELKSDLDAIENVIYTTPMDYFTFQKMLSKSYGVITDSGGIQEETTFLNVPCVTLRDNTERPVTIDLGTNTLLNFDPFKVIETISNAQNKRSEKPPLWDGISSERIVQKIEDIFAS